MGSKNKLKRFKENLTFDNVIQPERNTLVKNEFHIKANWNKLIFKNNFPIVLEIGCGKGEYTVNLAEKYPQKNYIGIDIKGARFWRGAKDSTEKKLKNVIFLRAQVELIDKLFDCNEISEIWITFPDPQIKLKREKHRLINLHFIELYKKILKNGGLVNVKTDSEFLHGYTLGLIKNSTFLELIYSNHDIYNLSGSPKDSTEIQTFYELKFLKVKKAITFIIFKIHK